MACTPKRLISSLYNDDVVHLVSIQKVMVTLSQEGSAVLKTEMQERHFASANIKTECPAHMMKANSKAGRSGKNPMLLAVARGESGRCGGAFAFTCGGLRCLRGSRRGVLSRLAADGSRAGPEARKDAASDR